MKAHLERDWPKHGYNLYLFAERVGQRIPFAIDSGRILADVNRTAGDGEELPVTLFVPYEVYEAIRRAMIGEAIDNDDALKDTRMVRDRLLVMIESEWQSRQLEVK